MSKVSKTSGIFSPKSFVNLLGAEYHLMRDAGALKRFFISSLLIIIILLLTSVSLIYALDLLFHLLAIEIILSIFFCLLFFCIYIFLLNTFAKQNRARKGILNLSNIIRIGFVVFMGFLAAQPLSILIYNANLSPAVKNYKHQLLKEHTAKIEALMQDEMKSLTKQQGYYTKQKKQFGTAAYDNELNKIAIRLQMMQDKTTILTLTAQQTIEKNSFFLFRVQTVSKYPISWFLTLFIILLFLMPGYLIYSIPSQHEYYVLKKAQEKNLIMAAYNVFARRYKAMFTEQVIIFSRFEDPPFNTTRKQPCVPASMTEFLQKYLDNG